MFNFKKKFSVQEALSNLRVGQLWRSDWNHPFANPWNARILEIKEDGNILIEEWIAGLEEDKMTTEWWCGNFVVFYIRLIGE